MMQIYSEVGKIAITSLVSIVVLFGLCKLVGQRQIGQMSLFDYVTSITIGSIAAELATDLEAWWQPLTATVVYGIAALCIDWFTCKSIALRRFFNGRPVVLYQNGRLYPKNLLRARLDLNEFLSQCRVAGYFDLSQLESAVLETNGQISFLPTAQYRPATPSDLQLSPQPEGLWCALVLDGSPLADNLEAIGHNPAWLQEQLTARGYKSPKEVFLAMYGPQGQLKLYPRQCRPERDWFE
ncbi:hypothetical protein B5G38_09110 [Gemmiger sp. An87]|nr:hypothetical protein B5G38_09110 [Gemmiger sp. An87]